MRQPVLVIPLIMFQQLKFLRLKQLKFFEVLTFHSVNRVNFSPATWLTSHGVDFVDFQSAISQAPGFPPCPPRARTAHLFTIVNIVYDHAPHVREGCPRSVHSCNHGHNLPVSTSGNRPRSVCSNPGHTRPGTPRPVRPS